MSKYDRFDDLSEVEEVEEEVKHKDLISFPRPKWSDFGWWRDRAACAQLPKSIFFPINNRLGSLAKENVTKARSVCSECPVLMQCYEFAVRNNEQYGIWAGTTPKQRDAAYRKLVATGILETPKAS